MMVSSKVAASWQQKGSHLGDGPGGFAVCNMWGEERFASHTTGHATALWIWTTGGLDISSIFY